LSAKVRVGRCRACGWRGLPARLRCPVCGSERMHVVAARRGTLLDATTLERAPGGLGAPVRIGAVRLRGGGVLVARVEGDVSQGASVRLDADGGAVVASPR
jgi:uncharacterized OB-fold protein